MKIQLFPKWKQLRMMGKSRKKLPKPKVDEVKEKVEKSDFDKKLKTAVAFNPKKKNNPKQKK